MAFSVLRTKRTSSTLIYSVTVSVKTRYELHFFTAEVLKWTFYSRNIKTV